MKKIQIATSPLTGCIFAGTTLKDGRTWGANKQDVTIEAIVAVARHGVHFGEPIIISSSGGVPEFKVTAESLLDQSVAPTGGSRDCAINKAMAVANDELQLLYQDSVTQQVAASLVEALYDAGLIK